MQQGFKSVLMLAYSLEYKVAFKLAVTAGKGDRITFVKEENKNVKVLVHGHIA